MVAATDVCELFAGHDGLNRLDYAVVVRLLHDKKIIQEGLV